MNKRWGLSSVNEAEANELRNQNATLRTENVMLQAIVDQNAALIAQNQSLTQSLLDLKNQRQLDEQLALITQNQNLLTKNQDTMLKLMSDNLRYQSYKDALGLILAGIGIYFGYDSWSASRVTKSPNC
jgi:hypothetical protein